MFKYANSYVIKHYSAKTINLGKVYRYSIEYSLLDVHISTTENLGNKELCYQQCSQNCMNVSYLGGGSYIIQHILKRSHKRE